MSKYIKSELEYENVDFEAEKIQAGMKRHKNVRKLPTSIALDPSFLQSLKLEAQKRGIPYQIMLRMFIIEGFEKMLKTSPTLGTHAHAR